MALTRAIMDPGEMEDHHYATIEIIVEAVCHTFLTESVNNAQIERLTVWKNMSVQMLGKANIERQS